METLKAVAGCINANLIEIVRNHVNTAIENLLIKFHLSIFNNAD